ncbi:MAG: hypothetical protein EA392_00025 [Cryomorphaceae bacterium]|nr:MAG: hypothetical protein EA392_00025 [Cryomorphaceae bacterium]
MKTWRQINAERVRYINYGTALTAHTLRSIREKYAASIRELGDAAQALNQLSEAEVQEQMQSLFIDIYQVTGVAFARREAEQLQQKGMKMKQDFEVLESQWMRHMRDFVIGRCGLKIQQSTRTLFADIERVTRQVIQAGIDEGWGPAKVAQEIMKQQAGIDRFRAMRIARTEVVGASNEGSYTGAGAFSDKTRKIWVAALMDTRDSHEAMHETRAEYSEAFRVPRETGGSDEMQYPGDPSGSAENVINCRCGITYEPVNNYIDELLNE